MTCGIYKITNIKNGKIYIGSAKNVENRWKQHFRNPKYAIGSAIKKHGPDSFKQEIIEETDYSCLQQREQYYLDHLRPFGKTGYNLSQSASSSRGIVRSEETKRKIRQNRKGKMIGKDNFKSKEAFFLNPCGEVIKCESVNSLAKKYNLKSSALYEIIDGKRYTHNGWRIHPPVDLNSRWEKRRGSNNPQSKPVRLISPFGENFEYSSLKEACIDNDLDPTNISRVARGIQIQHKGWRAQWINKRIEGV